MFRWFFCFTIVSIFSFRTIDCAAQFPAWAQEDQNHIENPIADPIRSTVAETIHVHAATATSLRQIPDRKSIVETGERSTKAMQIAGKSSRSWRQEVATIPASNNEQKSIVVRTKSSSNRIRALHTGYPHSPVASVSNQSNGSDCYIIGRRYPSTFYSTSATPRHSATLLTPQPIPQITKQGFRYGEFGAQSYRQFSKQTGSRSTTWSW